jgi:hypothetical protein
MIDPILFIGGCLFIALAFLSYFDRDRLWKIYSLERGWRNRNPERTLAWDRQTKRLGVVYLVLGVVACVMSYVLVQ